MTPEEVKTFSEANNIKFVDVKFVDLFGLSGSSFLLELVSSSRQKNPDVIEALLDWGIDVNVLDKEGATPLIVACEYRRIRRNNRFTPGCSFDRVGRSFSLRQRGGDRDPAEARSGL